MIERYSELNILEILSLISTIAVALIGIGSLFLAYRTYKLDKINTISKLSIKPIQKNLKMNEDIVFENEYYKFRDGLDKAKEELGKSYGFPTISLNEKYNYKKFWMIELLNAGDFASTNIKLNYSIVVKRTELEFGFDESYVEDDQLVDFYTYNNEIEVLYMGGNQTKELFILAYDGEFPEADLIINSLSCDQNVFISKPIKVDVIKHPDFDMLEDSPHLRKMWGLMD